MSSGADNPHLEPMLEELTGYFFFQQIYTCQYQEQSEFLLSSWVVQGGEPWAEHTGDWV